MVTKMINKGEVTLGKDNFIKTTDKDAALMLMEQGFNLINQSCGVWTFQNNQKTNFERFDKITYSNTLTF